MGMKGLVVVELLLKGGVKQPSNIVGYDYFIISGSACFNYAFVGRFVPPDFRNGKNVGSFCLLSEIFIIT